MQFNQNWMIKEDFRKEGEEPTYAIFSKFGLNCQPTLKYIHIIQNLIKIG